MKWFKGTIPEAIQASKDKRTVFVVYIFGEDELSKKMDESWEDTQASALCDSGNFVAIRIAAKSEDCTFFSQIYPVVVVPSTFFIGENGVPLEVTGGFVDAETFRQKINEVLVLHKQQVSKTTVSDGPDANKGGNSASACPEQASQSAQVMEPIESIAESTDIPQTSIEPDKEMSSEEREDLKVRVEKAKQLLEEKRIQKMEKEKESQKEKEKERRQMGKDVQSLKQYQEEMKWKEAKDEIRKDKEEDLKAKQRIREQIARDREERSARYKKEKEAHEKAKEDAKKAKLLAEQQAAIEKEAKNSDTARLQVRLLDGSSITQQFSSSDPLQSVVNFIKQHTGVPVRLSTTYPRRTFTEEDMSRSLASLQLAPTATVIALPQTDSKTNVRSSGAISSLFSMIFAPFLMIWNYISLFLFGSSSQHSSQSSPPAASPKPQEDDDIPDDTRPHRNRPQTAYKRRTPPTGSTGKVFRMSDMKRNDDDDDMNTWNGNSTQQM